MQKFEFVEEFLKKNGIYYEKEVSMKNITSFKIGGVCKIVAYPSGVFEVKNLIGILKKENVPYFFIGNGSNVLASDDGFFGVLICSKNLNKIKILSNNKIYCESGVNLFKLCLFLADNSFKNFEELYGIPGSFGGAIFMNAGAYGREIKDCVLSVLFLDENGLLKTVTKNSAEFSYRHSVFQKNGFFIVAAILKLERGDRNKIRSKMMEFLQKRKEKQPLNQPSAGSIFKRPKNNFAAKLIEEVGLKGKKVGDAMVSEKHCGFIVNCGGATARDVKELIKIIEFAVKKEKNVELKKEIIFIE